MPTYQYDGEKGGAKGRLMIRQHLVSRSVEIGIILKVVGSEEDGSAMTVEPAPRARAV